MNKNTYINMRINDEIKKESESILNELGLSLSNAIDLYLAQIIKERGIPFEVRLAKRAEEEKKLKLAKIINSLGGVENINKYQKIINLYAKGDISYDVALYAIKRELANDWTLRLWRDKCINK